MRTANAPDNATQMAAYTIRCLSGDTGDDNGDATDHNGGGAGNGKADGAADELVVMPLAA